MSGWNDDTGESSGNGPSWKWLVTGIAALTVPVIGGILFWIASNLQSLVEAAPMLNYRIDVTTKQLDEMNGQLHAINATLEAEQSARQALEYEYKALDNRLVAVENITDTIPDYIEAQKHADKAIKEALDGTHPKRRQRR